MLVDFDVRALHDTADGERPFAYTGEICMRGIEPNERRMLTSVLPLMVLSISNRGNATVAVTVLA